MIGDRGFDAAGEVYAERGREAKRQWQEVANRTYGVKVASDWRPDGWLADMDDMTTAQADDLVTATREALAALHQVQAVTEAEAQTAAEAKAALPGLEVTLRAATKKAASGQSVLIWLGLPLLESGRAVQAAGEESRCKAAKDAMGS